MHPHVSEKVSIIYIFDSRRIGERGAGAIRGHQKLQRASCHLLTESSSKSLDESDMKGNKLNSNRDIR